MRNLSVISLFAAALLAVAGHAVATETPPQHVREYVPEAGLVGTGELNVFVFDVYDAALYAPQGRFAEDRPFALRLKYHRDITAEKIAQTSVQAMRDMGQRDELILADWFSQMREIFPDVKDGTVLTGIYVPGQETVFYDNKGMIGRIRDAEFGRYFFNIWLGDKTPVPRLRRQLLGTNG